MRVFNKDKTEELQEYDTAKGRLIEDVLITHYEEIEEVQEQFHYEVVRQYDNGGQDVKKIIDVEGVEYKPARDEKEDILVYIPYTEKELEHNKKQSRIAELKENLSNTDYQAIKFAEGQITPEEYEPIKTQRQEWRNEINELESQLENEVVEENEENVEEGE